MTSLFYAFTGASACIQLKKFNEASAWCDKGLAVSFGALNLFVCLFVCLFVFLEAPSVTRGVDLNTSYICTFPKRLSGWQVSENIRTFLEQCQK